ncbi:MAG: sporulation protein [Clostridiales bacterium]|jgi:sporulation protein YqfC|nr:sporulation protein [Clostridiales bacterium]
MPRKKQGRTLFPRLSEQMEKTFELPTGTLTSAAHIEMSGNRRAVVEGCQGILEYEEGVIRLNTGSGVIRFTGTGLSMSCMTEDSAVVVGSILSLEFMS